MNKPTSTTPLTLSKRVSQPEVSSVRNTVDLRGEKKTKTALSTPQVVSSRNVVREKTLRPTSKKQGGKPFYAFLSSILVLLMVANPVAVVFASEEEVVEEVEVVEEIVEEVEEVPEVEVYVAEEEVIENGPEEEVESVSENDGNDSEVQESATDENVDDTGEVAAEQPADSTEETPKGEDDALESEEAGGESDTASTTDNAIDQGDSDTGTTSAAVSATTSDEVIDETATTSDQQLEDNATSSDPHAEDDDITTEEEDDENTQTTSEATGGTSSGSSGGTQTNETGNDETATDEGEEQNTDPESAEENEPVEDLVHEGTEAPEEKQIDEAALRAEIEQVVEDRLKDEYETKLQQLLKERSAEKVTISNFQSEQGFSDADCELLSTNEIYCRKGDVTSNTEQGVFTGVFEDSDSQDSEVILQIGDIVTQITNNDHDDINPVYDEGSGKVVWQALINNRWQIMVYDVETAVTTQVTGGGYNNINPHTFGNVIVWQGWAGNNWDVFYAQLFENADGSAHWETVRVTDNDWPDVEPHIAEGMILWEALIGESWQVFSYDVYTSNLMQVSQGTGDNRNPRLVLLYESEEEGATQLVGFDVATQKTEVINNGENPKPLSEEIPDSPFDENQAAFPGTENTSSSSNRVASKNESES